MNLFYSFIEEIQRKVEHADNFKYTYRIGEVQYLTSTNSIRLAGRIKEISYENRFIILFDSTGQITVLVEEQNLLEQIKRGDIIGIEGSILEDHFPLSVKCSGITILSQINKELPDEIEWKKKTSIQRGMQRYLDFILNPNTTYIFVQRAKFIANVRKYLMDSGYIEVETPILVPIDDLNEVEQFSTYGNRGKQLFLRTCHEDRIKKLLIGGFDKLFELGKSFRKEQISWKHSPEFLQLECLAAYASYYSMMKLTQEMLQSCVGSLLGRQDFEWQNNVLDFSGAWPQISVRDAIIKFSDIDIGTVNTSECLSLTMRERGINIPVGYYEWYNLVEILIDKYVEPNLIQPTFLIDYPTYSNYYAKRKQENNELIERFELYIAGIEIASGYSYIIDIKDFDERLNHSIFEYLQRGKNAPAKDDDLILAKSYGIPPSAVVGFGIDRIVMLITNQESIHDVIWFPTDAR